MPARIEDMITAEVLNLVATAFAKLTPEEIDELRTLAPAGWRTLTVQQIVDVLRAPEAPLAVAEPEARSRPGEPIAGNAQAGPASGFAGWSEARTALTRAVPPLESLFSIVKARVPSATEALVVGLLLVYVQNSCGGSGAIPITNNYVRDTYETLTVNGRPSAPPQSTALSPLARVLLHEIRDMGGVATREEVLARMALSGADVDLGLSQLVRAGRVVETTPGTYAIPP